MRDLSISPIQTERVADFWFYRTPLEYKDFMSAVRGIGGEWRECAEQIMKPLDAWVVTGYEEIVR